MDIIIRQILKSVEDKCAHTYVYPLKIYPLIEILLKLDHYFRIDVK